MRAEGGAKSAGGGERRAALAFALAALGVWVAVCAYYPLTDTDIWWHLASARRMLAQKAFLRADAFCLASLGKPWIDLHWGFQLMVYALWKLGGAKALLTAKVLALWAAAALALRPHLHRRNVWLLLPLACFGFYHVRFYLDVRPLVVTLLGLALEYTVVIAFTEGRLRRPWLFLIPIQAVMANVQGLYLLGAFLVTCFAAGEWWQRKSKALLWTALALWFTGLLTPYGWQGFALPLALLGRITPVASNVFSSGIAENQPWLSLAKQDPRAALPFALFAAWVLFTFDRTRGRQSAGHALLFAGFGVLALMAVRNLPLFYLAGLMAAGRNLQVSPWPSGSGRWRLRFDAAGAALLAAVFAAYVPRIREAWSYELPGLQTPFRFPSGAVDYLEAHPLPGNIFNELRFGGYLEWRRPDRLSFLDGRMILRDAAFYREFLEVVDGERDFDQYRTRYGITHVLLPIAEDQRYLPLSARLLAGGWDLLYGDGAAVLLAAPGTAPSLALGVDSLPNGHPLKRALEGRFGANAKLEELAALNLAEFLAQAGKGRAALDLLRGRAGSRAEAARAAALATLPREIP